MSVLKTIFTWWNGATTGIHFTVARRGRFVGQDELGNKYYEARDDRDSYDKGRKRRWVVYNGYADASKVTPDWHGWLRYTFDEPPTIEPFKVRAWEKEHLPNLTGTIYARRPAVAIGRGVDRLGPSAESE